MSLRRFFRRFFRPGSAPARASPSSSAPAALPAPPFLLRRRSATWFIVFTVCVAVFTDIFLYGMVVPVMPFALTARVGIAPEQVQHWNTILIACYGVALGVGSPVAGLLADQTSSRRAPLLGGLVALAASTVLLCVGRSIAVLVAGRLLQGFSAAVVWSVGLALMADTMGQRIGLAMGYVGIAVSGGLLCAPLVGGAVYARCGYYAVYYVAFGLIVFDVLLRVLLVERKVARRWLKEGDDAGRLAAGGPDPEAGTTVPPRPSFPQASAAGPPRPQRGILGRAWLLLRSRRLLAALFGSMIDAGLLMAFETVLPLFVKKAFGWGSTAAGLLFLALYGPPLALAPPVGLLADRWGAKWLAVGGLAAMLPVIVCLRFVTDNTTAHKVLLAVLLSLLGTATTFVAVPLMAEISFSIEAQARRHPPGVWGPQGIYGLGYGLFNMAFALGGAAGSFLAGYVQAAAGWGTMTWVMAVWCAAGGLVVLAGAGEFRQRRPAGEPMPPAAAAGTGGAGGAVHVPQTTAASEAPDARPCANEKRAAGV